ncbi:DUF397 domain-containing protein [Streptomyces scopuliridis]|uniref:DUF397 domain-containing protein n=1 Tax=Streptomyces scopuliridis TaxID=452529 RepID=A0ACD4ZTH6_9ACTN|nr:DUF397 domain-containing protein [Streptomyces scopuliridis]WSC01525.1 DUF397 domain-containing protein [Streptomyces scopuliridis]WSC04938.1 DUF397 domain-containing protein [Streptomyces scopuliridis]
MKFENGVATTAILGAVWVKARSSNKDGNCVEVAALEGGEVAMRNSRFPGGPALVFTQGEMAAFINGVKGAEFDHMTA